MRALCAFLAAVALAGCPRAPLPTLVDEGGPRRRVGEPSLELSLPRHPGGERWTLAGSRGRVVLLDVWATWCEPCRDALPLYQDLATEFGPKGLEVYAVNIDADPRAITPFLEEAKVSVPVLLDPEAKVAGEVLHVKLMPTSYLIDKQGRVRFVHEGFDEAQLSTWLKEIEQLLAEPAP